MGRYRLTGALLCLIMLFCGQKLWAQGEINIRVGNCTGASVYNNGRYNGGIIGLTSTFSLTLAIENQSPTENLTLTNLTNIFNPAQMIVSVSGNTCTPLPVTLTPGQCCQLTVTLDPNISAVMEDTLKINNSDSDEGLYQVFIRITTLDVEMVNRVLVLNEVSQGPSGNKEFVEFLVVGVPGTCRDVRGWIFDDNSGRSGRPGRCGTGLSTGISTGHARLAQHPQWESIPVGSLIVIYNIDDRNTRIPADDPTDSNNDNSYIIPINNTTLLDLYPNCPSFPSGTDSSLCNNYTVCALVPNFPNNYWQNSFVMGNASDMFQLVEPTALDTFHHSVSWSNNGTNYGSTIFFTGSAAQRTFQFVNTASDNAFLQANWRSENVNNASPNGDSPGECNSPKNCDWRRSLRLNLDVTVNKPSITPNPSEPCQIFVSVNATDNVVRYHWDFDNDGFEDLTTTVPYANWSFPNNGSYTVRVRLETTNANCNQYQTATFDCYTFAKFSEIFYVRYDASRKGAVLNWATDNPNAETHVVERSLDGKNFQPIHEVKTAEKTNVHQLQYTDNELPIMAEKVYYRIRYRETSGATQTLPIRELRLTRPDFLSLAPNPTTAELNVSAPETIQSCTVIDATGRSILTYQAPDNKGIITLPTESLPEGVYWLLVQTARNTYYERWVKM